MKNLRRTFAFYLGMLFFSILFYQCCDEESFEITGLEDLAVTDIATLSNDTISNQFSLTSLYEGDVVYETQHVDFISAAWATSCEYNYLNPIVDESLSVSFSQDLVYQGEIISSGTNVLNENLPGLAGNVLLDGVEIIFTQTLIDSVSIPTGDCTIQLTAMTTDSLELDLEATVFFRFN
jgi:hypothetical protein